MALFMKHDAIDGESQVEGRKGFIELLSVSWGMTSSISQRKGSQGSQGVNVQDLTCMKVVDTTSAQIVHQFLRGTTATVEIQFVTTGPNTKPQTLWRIKLETCVITSYTVAGAGEERPTETFSLNFEKFFYEVFGPGDSLSGLSVSTGFDVFNGTPL
jgi:type VI secretion system secreted protein Hcp